MSRSKSVSNTHRMSYSVNELRCGELAWESTASTVANIGGYFIAPGSWGSGS